MAKHGNSKSNIGEYPPGMAPKMLNLLNALEKLEDTLEPIISKPHHESFSKMSSLDKSKMGMLEAYTVNSLLWVLMKTSTESVPESMKEDFKLEMKRVKEAQDKITEIESRSQRPRTDTRAAARMIKRGIAQNQNLEDDADIPDRPTTYSRKKKPKNEKPDNCESEVFKNSWQ